MMCKTLMYSYSLTLALLAAVGATDLLDVQVPEGTAGCASAANHSLLRVFRCKDADSDLCLPLQSVCNGVPECPGGEDEAVQECGCLANEFRCRNSCVSRVKRCDRRQDCDQGEDEQDCQSHLCPITHFKCTNHFCVPLHAVCDFVDDCGDRSDEINCPHRPCWHLEFTCANGRCLRPVSVCDGVDDCLDDSDEIDCAPDAFVRCGDDSLVHRHRWCDGHPDCEDNHADEIRCGPCDNITEFRCPNGRCIRQANVCDAHCDCAPLWPNTTALCADEQDCGHYYSIVEGVTVCQVGVSLGCSSPEAGHSTTRERCIALQYLCDGHNDCYNGHFLSDEFGCDVEDIPGHTFQCRDNRSLPESLRCDFKHDCLHGEDELDCQPLPCGLDEWRCVSGQCVPSSALCDLRLDCLDKSDETGCRDIRCGVSFRKCGVGGQCLPLHSWCDHFPDCPDGSDESNCTAVECGSGQFRCASGQCVEGHMRCYNSGNPRDGCADGSHLRHCEDWQCTVGQFKCQRGPCLHRALTCDTSVDCPRSWDDQDGCPFECSSSAPQCQCQDIHINCTGRQLTFVPADVEKEITWFYFGSNRINETLNNGTFEALERLLYLNLSNNSIVSLPALLFRSQWRLSVLDLQDNLLTSLSNGSFYGLASLTHLHLGGNRLEILQAYAFYGLYSLKSLDLSDQRIRSVEPEAFVGLHSLTSMDLSHNVITHLAEGSLRGMPSLLYLNLNRNRIRVIESNVFRSIPLIQKLVTDEFRFCCLARHSAVCLPPPDEFSSCEDLMSNLVLRLCVWLLGGVAIVGNLLVIVWRYRTSHCNQVHSFLITNLALGDLIMGSYLLVIAVVDHHYRGVYFIHDSSWRSSGLCAFAGFLSTFSSELSVFTLTVITLDRFLAIIFPFRVRRLEMARTRRLMVLGWLLAGVLSALPLSRIPYFHNFYGRSGVCLALHITADKPSGWEYSVTVFLFLNLASFSLIAAGYLWMFVAARSTRQAVARERRSPETAMAWRMTLLVATDAACWVPIICLGLASLAGFPIPPQVFAWVAVFVLPLNAAVNPVLYTLSTAPFLTHGRHSLLTFRHNLKHSGNNYSASHPARAYDSPKSDNSTCYSIIKQTSVRWHKKVDTAVSEHGEVVALSQLGE